MEHCDECGFDYDLRLAPGAGTAIVAGAAELAGLVTDEGLDVRSRRWPETWSPLEYASSPVDHVQEAQPRCNRPAAMVRQGCAS